MEQCQFDQIKKTVLYERHLALGARMVEFSGWLMPVYYQGIIPEHLQVRQQVGLFDVSHMGRVLVEGSDAERFLDYLSTNTIQERPEFSATYTVWSHPLGGCIDDLIVYKEDFTHYFVVVNAGNREKDLQHMQEHAKAFNVQIKDLFQEEGILAVQGPRVVDLLSRLFHDVNQIKAMHFSHQTYQGKDLILSRTGYTGEDGFEIYAPKNLIVSLWDQLLALGKPEGIMPIGLGARDTLRLEMGYALYGHEINEEISANESVSKWTVKLNKPEFIGKETLKQIDESAEKRAEYGIILEEPGIARAGYRVFQDGLEIGVVTSGTQSPSLNQAIAIILVRTVLQPGDFVTVQIRDRLCRAKVVKLPFLRGN